MKLALGLEVYNKAVLDLPIEAIETAERYGYHSVWTAEAYGSDALSTLHISLENNNDKVGNCSRSGRCTNTGINSNGRNDDRCTRRWQ